MGELLPSTLSLKFVGAVPNQAINSIFRGNASSGLTAMKNDEIIVDHRDEVEENDESSPSFEVLEANNDAANAAAVRN